MEAVLRDATTTEDHQLVAEAQEQLATFDVLQLDYDSARAKLEQAQQHYVKTESLSDQAGILLQLATLDMVQHNQMDAAREKIQKALVLFDRGRNLEGQIMALQDLGKLEMLDGDAAAASNHLRNCLSFAQQLGSLLDQVRCQVVLVILDTRTGRWTEARLALEQILSKFGQSVDAFQRAHLLDNLGYVEAKVGDLVAARRHWHEALELYRRLGISSAIKKLEQALAATTPPDPAACRRTCEAHQRNGELATGISVDSCAKTLCNR